MRITAFLLDVKQGKNHCFDSEAFFASLNEDSLLPYLGQLGAEGFSGSLSANEVARQTYLFDNSETLEGLSDLVDFFDNIDLTQLQSYPYEVTIDHNELASWLKQQRPSVAGALEQSGQAWWPMQ